jgi:hypothetical protein
LRTCQRPFRGCILNSRSVAEAVIFDASAYPLALQPGDSDPRGLAVAGEDFGHDEININTGSPWDLVRSPLTDRPKAVQPKSFQSFVLTTKG